MQQTKFMTLATSEDRDEIRKLGGTGLWRVKPASVHAVDYVVICAHNHARNNPVNERYSIDPYEAFMIGRISGLMGREKYRIMIDKAADLSVKGAWPKGARFSFTYSLATDILRESLDLNALEWSDVPAGTFA